MLGSFDWYIFNFCAHAQVTNNSCTIFLLRATSKTEAKGGAALAKKFAERVQEIEATEGSALHIKIEKWHEDNEIKEIEVGFPQMEDIKTLLIPRQHVLKRIDPYNSKPIEDVRRELRSLKADYVNIVVNGNHPEEMGVSEALDLYETFHHLERKDSWGAVPWSCTCVNSHCVCKHAGLITSVFNPAMKAGLKAKSASKIPFMSMQSSSGVAAEGELILPAPAQLALPAPAQAVPPPDKIVIPEVVLPSSEDDFEVLVSSLCTGSSPDSGDRHPPTHRDVHPCGQACAQAEAQAVVVSTVVVSTTCFEKGPRARSSTSPQLVSARPVCLSPIEGDILFFLEKNDDSVAVMCAPPAAGFLHEEGLCQDGCEEGNTRVSRWKPGTYGSLQITQQVFPFLTISAHYFSREKSCASSFLEKIPVAINSSRKLLLRFFSRENSCSASFLAKNPVALIFSRIFFSAGA